MADAANLRLCCNHFNWPSATSPTVTNHVIDASNEGLAWSLDARDTNAITHIGFRYGLRTGTPPTYSARLESLVATTGLPDNTDLGGGSPTAVTFTPPADATWDGTWQWVALTNSYTPTRGQVIVPTIRYSSGTIDGTNNSSFTRDIIEIEGAATHVYPQAIPNSGGTWSRLARIPIVMLRTASGRYGFPYLSIYNTRSASTVGHRHAFKFNRPAGSGGTFTVKGIKVGCSIASATGKAPILGLWSASGVIQNKTLDSDFPSAATGMRTQEYMFDEASLTPLSYGVNYYVGFEVADATSGDLGLWGITLDNAADGDAFPGGATWGLSTYNGSVWSDNLAVRPFIELILGDETVLEPSFVKTRIGTY